MNENNITNIINALNSISSAIKLHNPVGKAIFGAACAGIIVFILTELIKGLIINPNVNYIKLKKKIEFTLIMYADLYSNPIIYDTKLENNKFYDDAGQAIRKCAVELYVFSGTLILIRFKIPDKCVMTEASGELMGLSNSLYTPKNTADIHTKNNIKRVNKICEMLSISVKK
ncbi:MAG: hypothetical protein LKJ75_04095 [Clostridia bacterium]|jgi:hypothetical protein|nr:hypothetical protein [Clostridia bacterium]MCI2014362.1 hypothetical protein [Clostridia bacterium]